MLKAFKWIIDNNFTDDQLGFANYTNNFPELVHLDYDATILHTTTGFVNGCLYDYDIQKKDIPTFTELFGMSNYFLHIPGLSGSKGQKKIYNVISILFKFNIIDNDMYSIYGIKSKSPYGNYLLWYKILNIYHKNNISWNKLKEQKYTYELIFK